LLRRSKTDAEGGPIQAEGAHLLIVDDDLDAGETIARLFQYYGIETSMAQSIDDAVVLMTGSARPVDLVLVDFRQGGTSQGLKLLDRVRAHDDGRVARTRVVMMTDLDENRMFSWQSGIDGFLIRPFHADELVLTVTDALGRSDEERVAHRQAQMAADPHRRASGDGP
jgi:DNA-binding response OmpR family regulator